MNKSIDERLRGFPAALAEQNELNAVIADISDQAIARVNGQKGPLADYLLAIKDNLNLVETETTCASRILKDYRSLYTATAVQRLLDAGAHVAAKTNLDEFAMGSSTEHSCEGPARNPHNPELVPGGSSGGSAVVVATGLVDAALGSDTGGSVRQPAAFCGLYGLKPTYGRVSRYGLVAFASSFDQIGVFAGTTELAARVFESIAGHDSLDSTTSDQPVGTFAYEEEQARRITIGLPEEYDNEGVDREIRERRDDLVTRLKNDGFTVKGISLPHTDYGIAAYYILTTAEASSNLARFDGVRYGYRSPDGQNLEAMYTNTRSSGFGPEVQRRIMLGTYVLSAGYMDKYYIRAMRVRRLIRDDFLQAFKEVDLILTPTTPSFPFPIGGKVDDPLTMYLSDVFTVPMSLAGVPSMNIPVGHGSNRLPIGLQLTANYFHEETIFQLSRFIEQQYTF